MSGRYFIPGRLGMKGIHFLANKSRTYSFFGLRVRTIFSSGLIRPEGIRFPADTSGTYYLPGRPVWNIFTYQQIRREGIPFPAGTSGIYYFRGKPNGKVCSSRQACREGIFVPCTQVGKVFPSRLAGRNNYRQGKRNGQACIGLAAASERTSQSACWTGADVRRQTWRTGCVQAKKRTSAARESHILCSWKLKQYVVRLCNQLRQAVSH